MLNLNEGCRLVRLEYKIVSFLAGAVVLCVFATVQKLAIGAPLALRGYFVPVVFGGVSGLIIGLWQMQLRDAKNYLQRLNDELEARVAERTASLEWALAEVKTLKGILPMCSICKKVRDENGRWRSIDAYIAEYSEAEPSHSICPDCAKKHYPDLDIYD